MWPKLRVLARSSPTDKHTLVKGNRVGSLIAPPSPWPRWHDVRGVWLSPRLWVVCSQMPNAELLEILSQRKSLVFPEPQFPHWENGDNNGDSLQGLSGQSSPLHSLALTVSMEDACRGQPLIRADGQTGAWEKETFFQVTQCQAPAFYHIPLPCIVSLGEGPGWEKQDAAANQDTRRGPKGDGVHGELEAVGLVAISKAFQSQLASHGPWAGHPGPQMAGTMPCPDLCSRDH